MKQAKVLSSSDLKRVLITIDAQKHAARNRCAFMLSYLAGMRAKEIAALKIGSVLSGNGDVLQRIDLAPEMTKGSEGRCVHVSDRLCREIKKYLNTIDAAEPSAPLMQSQKHRRQFSAHGMMALLIRIYEHAGCVGCTSHSGRRTFITALASRGVGARVLMQLAGHKNLATTQRYIDVNDEQLRNAVQLL